MSLFLTRVIYIQDNAIVKEAALAQYNINHPAFSGECYFRGSNNNKSRVIYDTFNKKILKEFKLEKYNESKVYRDGFVLDIVKKWKDINPSLNFIDKKLYNDGS